MTRKKVPFILNFAKRGVRFLKRPLLKRRQKKLEYARTHETKKSFGNAMPEKTFYIVGADEGWCGLFAIIAHQLTHIAYAVELGYHPVIDLQNFNSQYIGKREKFKENAWEYFFQQPVGYGLSDISKAQNVIQSVFYPDPPDERYRISYATTIYDSSAIAYWREMFKKYVRFNQRTEDFIKNKRAQLFKNKKRILGVLCRGTDFTTLKPHNHPIQPEPIEVIDRVNKAMKEWKCDFVYLATEDADIYDLFVAHFRDKLILDDAHRWRTSDLLDGKSNANLFFDKKEKCNEGVKYLSQIYLLSQCTCFIAGSTRGSLGAMLMSEGFEKHYIYNLGFYK